MELQAERVKELNCGSCGAALEPAQYKPLSTVDCPECGQKVHVPASFGDLLLTGILGRGAAGVVCQALDIKLHRQVAVKILSDSMSDKELVEACKREAQAMARLNHRNIVQVHQIGTYRDQPFIVMEHLSGGSVEREMIANQAGPTSESETLRVAIDVAEGLGAAKRVNMIHLDVKPGNMLFDSGGTAKLIDFGTATFAHHEGEDIGTPYYVAPEIVRAQKPDFRADMFSLGATLFHILAGKPPYDGPNVKSVIRARLKEPAADLRSVRGDIHPQTAAVVARMLAIDPAQRHESYDDLLDALRSAKAETDSGPATPMSAPAPVKRKKSLMPIYAATALLLAMTGIAGVVVMKMSGGPVPVTKGPETNPAPTNPGPVISIQPTLFSREPRWKKLNLAEGLLTTSGAMLMKQSDQSVIVTGVFGEKQDVYTVVTKTDLRNIGEIGLEAIPDKSLLRGGPGRDGGFMITSLIVEAAPASAPGKKQKLTLTRPDTDFEQRGGEVAGVLDDNPATGWNIPTSHAGTGHTATFVVDKPHVCEGQTLLTFTIKHETQQSYLGKFRLWAAESKDLQPLPPTPPVVVVVPPPPPTPKPLPPPDPPKPPPPAPPKLNITSFDPPPKLHYTPADEGKWYNMDILSITSSANNGNPNNNKFKRLDDGSILCTEGDKANEQATYVVVAQTTLQNITGLRLDALPNDTFPQKGPGRAHAGNIHVMDIKADLLKDPADSSPTIIKFTTAVADHQQGGHVPANAIDEKGDSGWAIHPQTGVPHWISLVTAEPIPTSTVTYVRFTIKQNMQFGHFTLSATTNPKPAEIKDLSVPRTLSYAQGWVPVEIKNFKAASRATADPRPDGSVFIQGDVKAKDLYEFDVPVLSANITGIKLEVLHDAALPKGGPGRLTSGWFAIGEIALTAAPIDQPAQLKPVALIDPSADFATPPNIIDRAIDGKTETFWGLQSRPGEDRAASFRLASPITHATGSILTLKIDQQLPIGRFRVLATAMADPGKIRVVPIKAETAVSKTDDVELYLTFGGTAHTDAQKRDWKPAVPFTPNGTGFDGKPNPSSLPSTYTTSKDPLYSHALQDIALFRATVPNGKYQVTLLFCETDPSIKPGDRSFDILIEEVKVTTVPLDLVVDAGGVGKRFRTPVFTTTVGDGVLEIKFPGKKQIISGMIIRKQRS